MIWSAARMVASSCSTTTTVLPMSRSSLRVLIILILSLGCSPMLGSSSTYSIPMSPEPICVDKRIRCDSPPDRVDEGRFRGQVVQANIKQQLQAAGDFGNNLCASLLFFFLGSMRTFFSTVTNCSNGISPSSWMVWSATVTRNRCGSQAFALAIGANMLNHHLFEPILHPVVVGAIFAIPPIVALDAVG